MFSNFVNKHFLRSVLFAGLAISLLVLPISTQASATKLSDVQRTMLLNKPGVVFVSHYDTADLIIQSSAGYPQLSGKTYTVQLGFIGSGFVISPDGYIITNGHVVKTPEKQMAYQALETASTDIVKDIIRAEYQNQGMSPTDAEVEALVPQVIENVGGQDKLIETFYQSYQAGEVKLDNVKTDIYVQQGAFVSGKKIPIDRGMKADIRAVDFDGFTDQGEVIGKDIAILKVTVSNMPTVVLGDSSQVQVGDKVYAVGYPGAVTFQEFLAQESRLEATMTSGIISSLKTMTDGSQVLQTDAAITHGNSGGPAFNENGEVIGIASMGTVDRSGKEIAGFNYLRPINVAKEFMSEKNIQNTQGPVDEHFRKGMGYYENGKYRKAISEFQTALQLYPNLMEAQDYVKKSQEGISKQNILEKILDYADVTTVSIAVAVLLIIGSAIFYIRKLARKEKKMEAKVEALSHDK